MQDVADELQAKIKLRSTMLIEAREKEALYEKYRDEFVKKMRQEEISIRVEKSDQKELARQKKTHKLMKELLQACEAEDVPLYIPPMANILDNYQGKF